MIQLHDDELICPNCLISNYFFIGGGSWSPDKCPECRRTDLPGSLSSYATLSFVSKFKAAKLFSKMWSCHHGVPDKFSNRKFIMDNLCKKKK